MAKTKSLELCLTCRLHLWNDDKEKECKDPVTEMIQWVERRLWSANDEARWLACKEIESWDISEW